jgi:hypothetical protein
MVVCITTNHVEDSSGKVGGPYLYTWYVLDETSIDTFPYIMDTEE